MCVQRQVQHQAQRAGPHVQARKQCQDHQLRAHGQRHRSRRLPLAELHRLHRSRASGMAKPYCGITNIEADAFRAGQTASCTQFDEVSMHGSWLKPRHESFLHLWTVNDCRYVQGQHKDCRQRPCTSLLTAVACLHAGACVTEGLPGGPGVHCVRGSRAS